MTDYFVSSDGNNISPYADWDDAATSFASAQALATGAGDRVIVHNTFSETGLTDLVWSNVGLDAPNYVISSTRSAGTADVSYSAGASLTFSGDTNLSSLLDFVHWFGFTFTCNNMIRIAGPNKFFECDFVLTVANDNIVITNYLEFEGCTFDSPDTSEEMFNAAAAKAIFRNCSFAAGNDCDKLVLLNADGCHIECYDCDWTNLATGGSVFWFRSSTGTEYCFGLLSGCKLNATTSITENAANESGQRVEAYSFGNADELHNVYVEDPFGVSTDDTLTYRNSAATYDGTNEYSIQIEPTANGQPIIQPHRVVIWEDWADANPTLTVELLYDSATDLQNDECWLEIDYPDATDEAMRNLEIGSRAGITATPANLSAGTGTGNWTINPPMTNARSSRIARTISGGAAGVHRVTLCYAKGGTTPDLFVCPDVDVS